MGTDIVCKFGGTSVADARMVEQVRQIVSAEPRRRFVVVSAPGKRTGDDQKITDLLLLCHQLADNDVDYSAPFDVIRRRFGELAAELGVPGAADAALNELAAGLNDGRNADWVASRGEHINARILAAAFGGIFVETAEVIGIDRLGLPTPGTYPALAAMLSGDGLYIIPGFYGHGPDGEVKVFSRGGSDITGAVVARAVGAAVYENWTDVSGFMMADPRIVKGARPMREVTYAELRELSYMGATVLHEEAIFPVREAGIPIQIRNTNDPEAPGTRIVAKRDSSRTPVVGVAGKPSFSVIYLYKTLMNKEVGFGRRLLEVLEEHGINFEHTPTGIDSMSVVIADDELGDQADEVVTEMRQRLHVEQIDIHRDLALVTLVGVGMAYQVGIAARCFRALAEREINIRMINQGVSEINIIIGVDRSDFEEAVRALYEAFVDPSEEE